MIKLIASDMDGTLLNNNRKIDSEFFNVLDELIKKDIKMVFASGREYDSLTRLVPQNYRQHIIFASNNGNHIVYRDEVLFTNSIDQKNLDLLIDIIYSKPKLKAVMCTADKVYTNSIRNYLAAKSRGYSPIFTKNLRNIKENIIKCSLVSVGITQDEIMARLAPLKETTQIAKSGKFFIDVTCKGVHKGRAINFLQENFDISPSETMVFGDYHNDLEMLTTAEFNFAMKNAHPDILEKASFIAGYNYELGVVNEIKKHALGN